MTVYPIYAGTSRTTTILASTVNREDDWFSTAMARKRPDGTSPVRVMRFKLLVCSKCEARGKLRCRHQLFRMPHWMNNDKQRDVELISGKTAANEMYGDVHTDRTPAFPGKDILRLFSDFYVPDSGRPPKIGGIGMDANQGGALSNTAIVSWILDPATHKIVICGWENYATDVWSDYVALFERQLVHLRSMWPDMLVFVGVECNNSIVPGLINDYIPTLRKAYSKDVFMIYEDKSDTAPAWVNPGIGIRTTNKSKILMVSIMKNLLCQLLAMLPVDKLMFPYAPPRPAADGTRDTGGGGNGDANAISDEYHSLEEFKRQFLMFEKVVSISSTAETARYTYNGKANGQPDDLVMACLMMARIFWAIFSSRDPRYDEIRDMALAP